MYYTQEQIDRANQADLVSFLQSQGEQLTRAGNEYRWKRHDSLTVRGNKWYRHSQSKGGAPIDFVMEFYGKSFTEAVEMLTGEKGEAPPPDRPCPASLSDFRLPPPNGDNRTARNYLTAARRIDEDVTGFFFSTGDIYEEATHHNAVFVGRDESGIPRYAHQRGTAGNFRLDVKGSDKAFNFCYRGKGERLFVFEAPIDLLSFLCLFKKDWQKQSYLALGGVGEKALLRFLSDRPNIKTVYLCLDSDEAGNDACSRLAELVPEGLTVHRLIPLFKDWNEVLQHRAEITDGKYLREAIYGLKEPPQEETVEIIRMSEVDTQTVEWLWEPYIPFGKVTIVQGNPGEGKTTFALRLAAACTTGGTLPGKLYVLATHFHPDHFNREILTWKEQRPDIQYIFSKDILKSHRAKAEDAFYIKKGETYEDDTIRIDAFGSTDVGSSFLLHLQDWSIFHAGDLNNWHWSEESTEEEIRKANGDFLAEVKYLKEKVPNIDLVLFPVDRRMGKDYMKGAKQFIEQIKTTIFVPMHFSEDYEGGDALRSFAENAGCRFISITHRGESFEITK